MVGNGNLNSFNNVSGIEYKFKSFSSPVNTISLTRTEAANYDILYFIPVEVNNLTDEEKLCIIF